MPQLILLRHGESQWNLENRFTGWVDIDLSPKGEEEARIAGLLLKPYKIDYVFTSALKRAQRTTDIVLEQSGKTGLPIAKNEALNERHYGDLQGLNKADIGKQYGQEQLKIWRRSYDVPPPNGESLKDTQARVIPYYKEHIEPLLKKGKNVLVSAHGNSLRALVMYLEKLTPEEIVEINIPTGVPYIYDLDENLNIVKKTVLDSTKSQS
jgi:2,3-bisphosphoglycerate-dependent phosphoglycerate mutase